MKKPNPERQEIRSYFDSVGRETYTPGDLRELADNVYIVSRGCVYEGAGVVCAADSEQLAVVRAWETADAINRERIDTYLMWPEYGPCQDLLKKEQGPCVEHYWTDGCDFVGVRALGLERAT